MSRLTNQDTEGSVSCGFYNGPNRKYYAEQMSSIFDGIITDGIFANIGDGLVVTQSDTPNVVNVGKGKCWFNHTWTLNDAVLPLPCPSPPDVVGMQRIDAVVVEIDTRETVRDNFIKVIEGIATSVTPSRPILNSDEVNGIYRYALAYIYRTANNNTIIQADITDVREETGFITGPLEVLKGSDLAAKWFAEGGELDVFMRNAALSLQGYRDTQEALWDAWVTNSKQKMSGDITDYEAWILSEEQKFLDWFNAMKGQLSTDAAGNLQNQIDKREVESLLMHGFPVCTKTMSDDGLTITSVEPAGSLQRSIIKTFSSDFSTCMTILYSNTGAEIGRLDKTFSQDGNTISSVLVIL